MMVWHCVELVGVGDIWSILGVRVFLRVVILSMWDSVIL